MNVRAGVKDVARLAGVSVGTVSNVLNRPDAVSPATREKVEAAISELRFVRNESARQLRAGQSSTVGAVLLDVGNPFYTALARGIEDRLNADRLTLMIGSSDEDPQREERYLRLFAEEGLRGVLVAPCKSTPGRLETLSDVGIPVVLLDSQSDRHPSVGVDHVSGARQAVRHLVQQGHRKILFLNGPRRLEQAQARLQGAREAVEETGLDPDAVLTVRNLPGMSADDGQRGFDAAWESGAPRPTAVFCVNDIVALGVMRELRRRGLDIPGDVAVVGYDDVYFASELITPLTSVHQPVRELGWAAADLLLKGPDASDHLVFRPELVIRASSTRVL